MAITKPSDLFDFDAWHKELERLESRKEKYSQSVIQSNERIQKSYNENLAKLKELDALMRATGTQKAGSTSAIGNMGKEVDKLIAQLVAYQGHLKAVSESEKINELAIEQLTKSLKALETEYKRLDPTSDNFASDQQRIAGQVKQVTSAINAQSQTLKVAKKTVDEANNSYNKLSRQTAEMKSQLRGLDGAFNLNTGALNKNNAAGAMLAKQIKINDAALKKMDATMGNHQRNVGNYSSAMKQLGLSLRGGLVTFLGVTSAFEAISQSLVIIDQFTRLRLGLEAISASSQQVSQRFALISSIADKTGQDIGRLSEAYISFAAATRNTALEGRAGDAIFKSFSASFAALGKSSEVAERGLYAVQQMISKSKVSSEELNQQLSEALPGANKLFADAMRLSTEELADQMRKGKILATDVLPKVAIALDKIYGERAQLNTTTIAGSFTRFTNQISLFLDTLNKDKSISGFFSRLNNGFTDSLKGLNRLIEKRGVFAALLGNGSIKENLKDQKIVDDFRLVDDPNKRAATIFAEQKKLGDALSKLQGIDKGKNKYDFLVAEEDYTRQKALVKDLVKINSDARRVIRQENQADANRKNNQSGDGSGAGAASSGGGKKSKFDQLSEDIDKVAKQIEDELLADFNAGRELAPSDAVIEKWNKLYQQILAVSVATGNDLPGDISKLNNKLQKYPEDIASQIVLEPADKESKSPIEKAEKIPTIGIGLAQLLDSQKKELDDFYRELSTGSFKQFSDSNKTILSDQLKEVHQLELDVNLAITDLEKEESKKRLQIAEDELARKKDIAKTELEDKKKLYAALADLTQEAGGAVFEILGQQRQADIEANQRQMEHELSLVKGNEEAQNKIKREFAKKDLELRQRQARMDKAEAAFKIAINTAVAISSVSPVVPLMVIAAALGAIQLGVVLAKPIPQFYKGTKNAPEGPAQVGEKGAEIRESKGKMYYYDKPTVTHLERGDKIYTAEETSRMLANNSRATELNAITNVTDANSQSRADIIKYQVILMKGNNVPVIDYNKMRDSFVAALDENPTPGTVFDEHGFSTFMRNKNTRVQSFNRRYSLSN